MNTLAQLTPKNRQNLRILFTAGLLFWSSLASLLPTLPVYIKRMGVADDQLGIIFGAFALGLVLCRPAMGQLADQRGRKGVLIIGTVVAAIAPVCHLLTQSVVLLSLIRVFHGISIAAFTTAYSALIVDLAPPENRGEVVGYMSLVNPIGMAIGPMLGGYLGELTGDVSVFWLATGLGLVSYLCAGQVTALPQGQTAPTPLPDQSIDSAVPSSKAAQSVDQGILQILLSERIRIPTLTMLLVGIAFGAIATFIPLYIKDAKVDLNVGLFYTAAALASFTVRFVIGKASDRYGRGPFITLGLAFYGLALFTLWQASSPALFLLAGALEGFGGGTLLPMMISLVADRCQPYERGRVFGLFMSGFDVGIGLAGPILGLAAKHLGYRGLYGIATIVALAGLLLFTTLCSRGIKRSLKFAWGMDADPYAISSSVPGT